MKYETKDSGQRASFSNGGVRDTQEGKPRFDLVFPKNVPYKDQLFTRLAELMARGASKYEDRNWEQFADEAALERARGSALRHLVQWVNGEDDEDHGAAVVFNIMAADYIEGVLDGSWSAIPVVESGSLPAQLWEGTADPQNPPPDHVRTLKLLEYDDYYHLRRAFDNRWYWIKDGVGLEDDARLRGDFNWFTWSMPYKFKEVR